MKYTFIFVLVCLIASPCAATVINGDFENGDLTGWTVSWDYYGTNFNSDTVHNPLPIEELNLPNLNPPTAVTDTYLNLLDPVAGDYASCIYARQGGIFFDYDNDFYEYHHPTITISQDIEMNSGDVLMGWMSLFTDDPWEGNDLGYVSINGNTIFSMDPRDAVGININPDPWNIIATPWFLWTWEAPADGIYTLSLNVRGDDDLETWAYFDEIQCVPEPSILALLIICILIFSFSKFHPKFKKNY